MAKPEEIMVAGGLPVLAVTVLLLLLAFCLVKGKGLKLYISWVLVSCFIHFFIEGGFAMWHETVVPQVKTMKNMNMEMFWAQQVPVSSVQTLEYWRDWLAVRGYAFYAKYDFRYGHSDPVVITIGWMEVFMHGPLSLWVVFEFARQGPLRHLANIVLTSLQITGTIVYFVHPMFAKEQLFTSDPFDLYVWVYFLNAIWIFVPGVALVYSCQVVAAILREYKEPKSKASSGKKKN